MVSYFVLYFSHEMSWMRFESVPENFLKKMFELWLIQDDTFV